MSDATTEDRCRGVLLELATGCTVGDVETRFKDK
jgi:hypothetical protein